MAVPQEGSGAAFLSVIPLPARAFRAILHAVRKTLLTFLVLCAVSGHAQKRPSKPKPEPKPAPEISASFSKLALKALLAIQRQRGDDSQLVDAAMVDLQAEVSNEAEKGIVWHLGLIEFYHSRHVIDEGACIFAWSPRLRALSAEIPKECAAPVTARP